MAGKESPLKTAVKAFGEIITGNVVSRIHTEADKLMAKARHNVLILEERLIENLAIALAMLAAVVFFVLSILFYMMDYLRMTRMYAFLAVAIVCLLIAFFMKYRSLRRDAN